MPYESPSRQKLPRGSDWSVQPSKSPEMIFQASTIAGAIAETSSAGLTYAVEGALFSNIDFHHMHGLHGSPLLVDGWYPLPLE